MLWKKSYLVLYLVCTLVELNRHNMFYVCNTKYLYVFKPSKQFKIRYSNILK